MNNKLKKSIFKRKNTIHYTLNQFISKPFRNEITTAYAFFRMIDDYVDENPQKKKEFFNAKKNLEKTLKGKSTITKKITKQEENALSIITDFSKLARKKQFEKKWIDDFMNSMESDLNKQICTTKKQSEIYIRGSAESFALFMAQIFNLPKYTHKHARVFGRSMQMINIIRDVDEDLKLGRWYLPLKETKHTLKKPTRKYIMQHQKEFCLFMKDHIELFYQKIDYLYQQQEISFPKKIKIIINTAIKIYLWTAKKIEANPMIVFEKKVKPNKLRIISILIQEYIKVRLNKTNMRKKATT